MSTIVLERQLPQAVTDEELEGMKTKAEPCFEINGVTRVITYLSKDRMRFVCIFEAADVEAVRRAMDSAGMSYDAVYVATSF